tara:strand:- start:1385 stop:3412 length:2028 start_codon:yes stop_codon:yes gene_type:complete
MMLRQTLYSLITLCILVVHGPILAAEDASALLTERYESRLAELDVTNADAHYQLALWALDQYDKKAKNIEAYDLTIAELKRALELDPATPHAKALLASVAKQHKDLEKQLNPDFLKMAFAVIGGLGLFLLGMKNMSDGMQAVAGHRLRRMIGAITDNRFIAVVTGLTVTCLVQSSSITTVLVVGFVNSGLMMLHQAIGVIMGANIGTTITGWILVLKIGKWGLPILGVSAFLFLFSRSERVRYLAMTFMGLGMIFFGLELMKNGFKPMRGYPSFEAAFEWFHADSYFGILKCAAIGCVLTFLVQSSSATLGITIGLAAVGAIPFTTAAALVLGENVGTTITAWLASIGATTNAKRAAYFHVLFNLIGVAWITAMFHVAMQFVSFIIESSFGVNPIGIQLSDVGDPAKFAALVTAGIAMTHTTFNITNTIIFLPFVRQFAQLLERIIPDRGVKEVPHLAYLDVRMVETPAIGIQQSLDEIVRMSDTVTGMMVSLKELSSGDSMDEKSKTRLFEREEALDLEQKEITEFLGQLLSGHVPHDVTEEGTRQLRLADELESVSDYIVNILKLRLKMMQEKMKLSDEEHAELTALHDKIADYLVFLFSHLRTPSADVLMRANTDGDAITHLMKDSRERHLGRVAAQHVSPLQSLIYTDMLTGYRKIKDHGYNIAEALAGQK